MDISMDISMDIHIHGSLEMRPVLRPPVKPIANECVNRCAVVRDDTTDNFAGAHHVTLQYKAGPLFLPRMQN